MSANSVVRARIDWQIKEEATVVLAAMGLTVSDAFRMLLTRVAREKALPFEPLVPNAVSIAAMKDARRGAGLKSSASIERPKAGRSRPPPVGIKQSGKATFA